MQLYVTRINSGLRVFASLFLWTTDNHSGIFRKQTQCARGLRPVAVGRTVVPRNHYARVPFSRGWLDQHPRHDDRCTPINLKGKGKKRPLR